MSETNGSDERDDSNKIWQNGGSVEYSPSIPRAQVNEESLEGSDRELDQRRPSQLELLDEFAFDEMNLIEIPFCTLQKRTTDDRVLPLSDDHRNYLRANEGSSLPTALAQPLVLGLLWMTLDRNGFNEPTIQFTLRELIENYMFPERFLKHRASGQLVESVIRELNRIKETNLCSDRWFDRKRGEHVRVKASIIDRLIEIPDSHRKIFEITWGIHVYESVRARYTKGLNLRQWLEIRKPLDQRLYRWLDRQLATKNREVVKSCQGFAKYKLFMLCKDLDRGGRTASSYVVRHLGQSLERLNGIGFAVQMTVDESFPDFRLTFEKIPGNKNEIVEVDPIGELILEFLRLFVGLSNDESPVRFREADRKAANAWLEAYGFEKAKWMVGHAHGLHAGRGEICFFRGLERYEPQASVAYDRAQAAEESARSGQLALPSFQEAAHARLSESQRRDLFAGYRSRLFGVIDDRMLSPDVEAKLEKQVAEEVSSLRSFSSALYKGVEGEARLERLRESSLATLRLKALGAIPESEFLSFGTESSLRAALSVRHPDLVFDDLFANRASHRSASSNS